MEDITYDASEDSSIGGQCGHNNIWFNVKGYDKPIIELKENGDIFVKGKLIENDKELVDGMREFLGFVKQEKSVQ